MNYQATVYLPVIASSLDDLRIRSALLEPIRKKGIKTGLMVVLKPKDFSENTFEQQLHNIQILFKENTKEKPLLLFMHPNMPLEGTSRFNFLDNAEFSKQYIEKSIDFIEKLPSDAFENGTKYLSFHLNSLIPTTAWVSDYSYWMKIFHTILHTLRELKEYADLKGVQLAIENTPTPEFGDRSDYDHLRNPFPLLLWRKEIEYLREIGFHLVVDICHSYIVSNTLQEVQNLVEHGHKSAIDFYGFFSSDLSFSSTINNFSSLVLDATYASDIWHISDEKGIYKSPPFHKSREYFHEGITLFEGDIPKQQLTHLIQEGFQKPIKIVIEVNETDFVNNPNTQKSISKILELL